MTFYGISKTIKVTKYYIGTESRRINIIQGQEGEYVLLFIPHKSKQLLILLTKGN